MRYVPRTPPSFKALLREYADLARNALFEFLPEREPRAYLYDLIRDYPRRGGRMMRPVLHMASAQAHGASLEQAMSTAVAVEMLHNGLLVLDDIQDESEERRGEPTLHRTHGVPMAINAGSSMSILSLVPLLDNVGLSGPEVALWLFEAAIEMAQNCAEGQAMELGWRRDNRMDISPSDYLDMVLRKTCAYSTMFPIRAGAIVGLRTREVPESVTRFAFLTGAAFQVQDDLLNVCGYDPKYGKEPFGDILEGKRTLLTIHLLAHCTDGERQQVRAFLALPRAAKTQAGLNRVVDLMRRYGSAEYTRQVLNGLVGAAQAEFDMGMGHLSESRDKEFLRNFPTWVIEQP